MKHILYSCDACNVTVPQQATGKWWGHKRSGLQVVFAPLTKRNRSEFETGHVCSELCLAAVLKNYAETVDRKAEPVAAAGNSMSYYSHLSAFGDLFGPASAPKNTEKGNDDETAD